MQRVECQTLAQGQKRLAEDNRRLEQLSHETIVENTKLLALLKQHKERALDLTDELRK